MMYIVNVVTAGKEYTLLDLRLRKKYLLMNAVLKLSLNHTGRLTFKISPTHPNFEKINLLTSVFKVYRVKKDKTKEWLYSGRAVTPEEDFYKRNTIECEGILAYLIDSKVRPYEFSGSPYLYLNSLRQQHNSQVGVKKQFLEGIVEIDDADNNNYITHSSSQYPNTLDEIMDKLVDPLGLYLNAREENGHIYLDCVSKLPHNTQKIKYGKNLLDFSRKKNIATLFTAVIPLGAKIEEAEDDGIAALSVDTLERHLTIQYYCPDAEPDDWAVSYTDYCTRTGSAEEGYEYTFVTGETAPEWMADTYYYGLDYVYDREARAEYDIIATVYTLEDVTLQSNLFRKGKEYLTTCLITDSLEVSAADLSMNRDDITAFKLGWVTFESKPHGINAELLLSEMELYLLEPLNSKFTIGHTVKTLTEKSAATNKNFESNIQKIENAATSIAQNASNAQSSAEQAQDSANQANNDLQEVKNTMATGYVTTSTFEAYQKEQSTELGKYVKTETLDIYKKDQAAALEGYVKKESFTQYQEEVNAKISAVYRYKGSVENYESLPAEGMEIGDTYNLLDTGANYAWTDSGWDKLSETIDLSGYALKEEIPEVPEKVSDLKNDSGYMTGEEVAEMYVDKTTYDALVERVSQLEGGTAE